MSQLVPYVQIDASMKVQGRYKFQKRPSVWVDGVRQAGEVIEETPWSDNLITNAGLDYIMSGAGQDLFLDCAVGFGNATPLPTNTSLASWAGAVNYIQGFSTTRNFTVAPFFIRHTVVFRFAPGTATGNIEEVAVYFQPNAGVGATSGSTVHSRALVVDLGGSPTVVSKAADEYLDVTWEFTRYPTDEASGTFNMTIDGVVTPHDFVVRPTNLHTGAAVGATGPQWRDTSGFNGSEPSNRGYAIIPKLEPNINLGGYYTTWASSGALAAVDNMPNPGPTGTNIPTSFTSAAYTAGTYYRDFTLSWALNQANFNIATINFCWNGHCGYQMSLSPVVAKVNTKTFNITVRLSIANI